MFARVGLQRLFPAFPVVESVTISTFAGLPSSFTVDMPATRPDGDLYLCVVCSLDENEFGTVDASWNSIATEGGGVPSHPRIHAWQWVGSSEPSSYTVNLDAHSSGMAIIYRISGQHASPIDDSGTNHGGPTTAFNSVAVTTTTNATLLVVGSAADTGSILTIPFIEDAKGEANGTYYGFSHQNIRATGTTESGETTLNLSTYSTISIAIKGP